MILRFPFAGIKTDRNHRSYAIDHHTSTKAQSQRRNCVVARMRGWIRPCAACLRRDRNDYLRLNSSTGASFPRLACLNRPEPSPSYFGVESSFPLTN